MLPENDYQIIRLTPKFYLDYPNPPFTELEQKENRHYTCLLFQTVLHPHLPQYSIHRHARMSQIKSTDLL